METATEEMVWGLIERLQREGQHITPRAVAKIHTIIDDCKTNIFPDLSSQKAQAEWLRGRADRDK